MTDIYWLRCPKDERGNDPNDFRDDPEYLSKLHDPANVIKVERGVNKNPFAWVDDFLMTDEEMDAIADPEWVFENLIILGHITVIPAEPNGGKTTIMEWVCSQISDRYDVYYINSDISGVDAKRAHYRAKQAGYKLVLPDMRSGKSMDSVIESLVRMNESGNDLTRSVVVFDTLKKMVDVINKSKSKDLYKLLRSLSAKGMTIILLAHTNKHKDDDGNPIFEGTGDLRADVDEMIYLLPIKHEDGSMTVSTKPDKVRGQFEPITFDIASDRTVTLRDFVDVEAERKYVAQLAADQDDVDTISQILATGAKKQTDLINACKAEGLSRRRCLTLLGRYAGSGRGLWEKRQLRDENNAVLYSMKMGF